MIFLDDIRDSETVYSEVLRGEEIKYVVTALGNTAYEKSDISFWFKYSLQSKLPKASSFLTVKVGFRRLEDLQYHILSLEEYYDDLFLNIAVKKAYPFLE